MENSKIPLKPSLANNNYLDTTFHCTIILTQTDILGEKSYWLVEWWPSPTQFLPTQVYKESWCVASKILLSKKSQSFSL